MTKVLPRIWCKVYSNGPHFSATPKDGYTRYVPENLALALFLRAELEKLGPSSVLDNVLLNVQMSSDRILPQTLKMLKKISGSESRLARRGLRRAPRRPPR